MFQVKGKMPQISLQEIQPKEKMVHWMQPSSGNRGNEIIFLTGTNPHTAFGRLLGSDFRHGVYD